MYQVELVDLMEGAGDWVDVILPLSKITSILEKSALRKAGFLPCLVEGTFLVQRGGSGGSPGFIAALWVGWESWPCYQESTVDPSDPKILHLWIQLILGSAKPQIRNIWKKFLESYKMQNWNLPQCKHQVHTGRVLCGIAPGPASKQYREAIRCMEGVWSGAQL